MITARNLAFGTDTVAKSTFTTATITPSANKLILLTFVTNGAVAPTVTSASGCGLTFTTVATGVTGDNRQRQYVMRATSNSTSTGQISISLSGNSNEFPYIISEFDNVDIFGTNGSNAIVQSGVVVIDSPGASGTATVTLSAFASQNNAAFGSFRTNGLATVNPGSGFTEIAETTVSHTVQQEFKNTADTTIDWTYSGNTGRIIVIGIELKYLPQGGNFLNYFI